MHTPPPTCPPPFLPCIGGAERWKWLPGTPPLQNMEECCTAVVFLCVLEKQSTAKPSDFPVLCPLIDGGMMYCCNVAVAQPSSNDQRNCKGGEGVSGGMLENSWEADWHAPSWIPQTTFIESPPHQGHYFTMANYYSASPSSLWWNSSCTYPPSLGYRNFVRENNRKWLAGTSCERFYNIYELHKLSKRMYNFCFARVRLCKPKLLLF